MEHFKQELVAYLDYYNNRRHQGKVKGLAACNSQTASPFSCLNNFYFKILSSFWGSLQVRTIPGFLLIQLRCGYSARSAHHTRPDGCSHPAGKAQSLKVTS